MNCPACGHDNIPGVDLCTHCGVELAGLDVDAWTLDPEDPALARPIGDLPLKTPLVLAPDATVKEAIELMNARHEGCVFVEAETELVGVFTERNVTVRVAARHRDPGKTTLREVMTPEPLTLSRTDPLAFAFHRMGIDGHRHVPVVDGGRLVGFLSARTVLEVLLEA